MTSRIKYLRCSFADYRADLVASGRYRPRRAASRDNIIEYTEIDISQWSASAGTGDWLGEDSFEKMRFPASEVPDGADFGVRVNGDSMEPVYHDQQIVWVQRCNSLLPGEVGLFIYDGDGYIKVYDEQEIDEDDYNKYNLWKFDPLNPFHRYLSNIHHPLMGYSLDSLQRAISALLLDKMSRSQTNREEKSGQQSQSEMNME